jgi:hypothetical protein
LSYSQIRLFQTQPVCDWFVLIFRHPIKFCTGTTLVDLNIFFLRFSKKHAGIQRQKQTAFDQLIINPDN